ncbi:ATP/GTP-binding protein [Gordonia lacunae]|uniref:ATP/GTP-binding protein n=1 Tax=Gordonia TaxID=2053 RepID=UPI00200AD559|nr:ATP/GTP-binding protein [Gordonia terrae]UPW12014.1 ATP/GTP-binding protein [Gordonia terrae]
MTTQRDHNDPDLDLAELVTAEQIHRLRQWWRWVLGRDSDQPAEDVWEPTTHHTADNYPDDIGEVVRREPPVRQRWLDKWGWYEDRPAGAWSTTRQAEALNLATTRQPVQHAGLLAGRNLMGQAAVRLDPFELYRDRVIDGVNVCAIGDIGSSKSSLLKTLGLYRQLILNRQIVFFDKKLQGDRGEYGVIADELGVESVTFRAGGGGVSLNLLDPAISTDGRHAGGVPGVVPAGQETLLLAVLRDAMERALSPREKAAVRVALGIVNERAANAGTEPLLKDVARQLIDGYGGQSERAFEQVRLGEDLPESVKADLGDFAYFGPRWASRSLEWGVDPGLAILELVDGALRGLVDRPTSARVKDALNHPFVHFDLSALPEQGPGLRVVMTTAQTWLANRLAARAADRKQTIAGFEEGWHLSEGSTGKVARGNMKLSRGLGLSTWSAFHHLSDHAADSPSRALMQESDIALLYRQARDDDAREVCQMFHLPPETKDVLTQLHRGQCLVWMKGRDPILMQHVRSRTEVLLTDTDNVLEGTT